MFKFLTGLFKRKKLIDKFLGEIDIEVVLSEKKMSVNKITAAQDNADGEFEEVTNYYVLLPSEFANTLMTMLRAVTQNMGANLSIIQTGVEELTMFKVSVAQNNSRYLRITKCIEALLLGDTEATMGIRSRTFYGESMFIDPHRLTTDVLSEFTNTNDHRTFNLNVFKYKLENNGVTISSSLNRYPIKANEVPSTIDTLIFSQVSTSICVHLAFKEDNDIFIYFIY